MTVTIDCFSNGQYSLPCTVTCAVDPWVAFFGAGALALLAIMWLGLVYLPVEKAKEE